jgi:YegS/Rv2252/BmrU family lipid kinase
MHAPSLVRDALGEGVSLIVAVGGDGTFNEVVNGFFEDGRAVNPEARLAIVPVGTGSDLRRTLSVPADVEAAARRIARGRSKTVDVGLATYRDREGEVRQRHFVNVADFGAGGAVVDKVNRTTKVFGGRISFLWAILTTLPKYRNTRVRYRGDGQQGDLVMNNFVVANGRYFGGGLMPAPHAEMDDGLLDVVIIGDITFKEARRNLGRLRRGEHLSLPQVTHFRAATVETECLDPALLDLDGEMVGSNPTRFAVLPRTLRILV